MLLARSLRLKAFVTAVAATGFVWVYEATILDSKFAIIPLTLEQTLTPEGAPVPGVRQFFSATAYCKGLVTSSGVAVQRGVVAADPMLLPVGSVVNVDARDEKYTGIYTVLDTGPAVQGREIDIYMWSCNEALQFGRRPVHLNVLRLGWNPRATTPSLLERMFKHPEPPPLPSRPLPLPAAEK